MNRNLKIINKIKYFRESIMNKRLIRNKIFKLALPAILEMTLHTLVWTLDTAMVGRLNAESITAVNLGAQIMFGSTFILGGMAGVGVTSLVARNVGAKNYDRASYVTSQGFLFSIIIGLIVCGLSFFFAEDIFKLIVDDMKVIELGSTYLRIVLIGGFFNLPYFISNSALRGAGNTVAPLIAAAVADIFNIIGDYVLIFGKFGFPRLGVTGAAIATAGALMLGTIVSLSYLFAGKVGFKVKIRDIFNVDVDTIKSLIKLGVPAGLENLMNEGSRMLSSFWIAQLGTINFAANSIAVAAESLSFMPGYGFAIAATTLVGQNLGSNDPEMAQISASKSVKYGVLLMSMVGMAFLFIPNVIMSFFTNEREVIDLAAKSIRIGALEQPTIAVAMVLSGALKGAGDTKGPFYISTISNMCIRMPLIFLIVFVFKLNVVYIWMATALQFAVEALLMSIRYGKGSWKTIEIE
jgi:putative MATE family efflux protein